MKKPEGVQLVNKEIPRYKFVVHPQTEAFLEYMRRKYEISRPDERQTEDGSDKGAS